MGLRRWLSCRLGDVPSRVDLVEPGEVVIDPPARAGLRGISVPVPWSVSRLQALFEALEHQPSVANDRAARLARYQLSQFWLAAPVDQLQVLYGSSIGDLQRVLLEGPLAQQELAGDEQQWRDQLINKLHSSDQAAQRVNVLLALMSYSPPGSLKLADPAGTVPDWLLEDYSIYCDPECVGVAPVGLLEPAGDCPFEPLTQRRGEAAMAWFRDEAALQRMQELIVAYSDDPTNKETCLELGGLRRVLAQLWLDVDLRSQRFGIRRLVILPVLIISGTASWWMRWTVAVVTS